MSARTERAKAWRPALAKLAEVGPHAAVRLGFAIDLRRSDTSLVLRALKSRGLVEASGGVWSITAKGREWHERKLL